MPKIAFLFLIVIVASVFSIGSAEAGLEICNETGSSRSVAIAYKDGEDWRSEGWWNIPDKDCKTVEGSDLKQRYYYYRAEHKGQEVRSGDYLFCTKTEAFDIIGDKDCEARGLVSTSFRVIDTGKSATDFTFTLTFSVDAKGEDAKESSKAEETATSRVATLASNVDMTAAPSFTTEPFEAGSMGEPFTVVGVFQGCENIDGWDHCAFHAEGARHGAGWGDGTPDEIMEALEKVAPGTRMLVRGDMKSFGDITAEVAIRGLEPVAQEPVDAVIDAMQGYWVSDADSSWYFQILGSERRDFYDGNLSANEFIRWASGCENLSEDASSTYIVLTNPEDSEFSECFHVVSVGRSHLILNLVGGNGQDLEFTRQ